MEPAGNRRWWQCGWWRSAAEEPAAAAGCAPSSAQQGSWAGGDADAGIAGNSSALVQRGSHWLPFLPVRPSAPAADRAAEVSALRAVSDRSLDAGARAGARLAVPSPRDADARKGPEEGAAGAASLHMVDLWRPPGNADNSLGASADATLSAAAAMHRAAAGQWDAADEPFFTGDARHGGAAGVRGPSLASGLERVHSGERGASAGGREKQPNAPDLAVVRKSGLALGDDSQPWTAHNDSELVPELPPAIMWLLAEAEVHNHFSPTSFECRAQLELSANALDDCLFGLTCQALLPLKAYFLLLCLRARAMWMQAQMEEHVHTCLRALL